MDHELPIRVTVLRPLLGVAFAMRRGKSALLAPSHVGGGFLLFNLSVRIVKANDGGEPKVLGPYVYGRRADRCLYLNSGTMAGQVGCCWGRRAKITTSGISWQIVEQVMAGPGKVLEVRIEGTADDGGPCCATVPLIDDGWRVSAYRYSRA